jgi:hypothetical protein
MSVLQSYLYPRLAASLNDLDHERPKDKCGSITHQQHPSSVISFDSNWHPAEPHEPANPPPMRMKTPPGFPAFGSRQATLLRLEQRPLSGMSSRLRNFLHSQPEYFEHALESGSGSSFSSYQEPHFHSPPLSPEAQAGPSDSRDLLRRTLVAVGMSRILDPDPIDRANGSTSQFFPPLSHLQSPSPRRMSLPPWVYMSTVPGPLARADDGSFVRGTFGPRSSGHGVGPRSVESLPMNRLAKGAPQPAETPATLSLLRRPDADSGHGRATSISGIGSALQDDNRDADMDEKRSVCDR